MHFSYDMKILASDFDGTLTFDYNKPVAKHDIDAIKLWQSKNNLFGVASGRSPRQILNEVGAFIQQDFMIAHNGAMVFDRDFKVIYSKTIEDSIISSIKGMINKYDFNEFILYSGDESQNLLSFSKGESFVDYHNIVEKVSSVHKILISASKLETIVSFEKDLLEAFKGKVESHRNVGAYTEITASNIDKSKALEVVIDYYQMDREKVYTFGDSHNDCLMIKNYRGYTLPHGQVELKKFSLGIKNNIKELVEEII